MGLSTLPTSAYRVLDTRALSPTTRPFTIKKCVQSRKCVSLEPTYRYPENPFCVVCDKFETRFFRIERKDISLRYCHWAVVQSDVQDENVHSYNT